MNMCEWCDYKDNEWLLHRSLHWSVYLADVQDYVGRCILVLNRHCGSLSELNTSEWIELKTIIDRLEFVYKEVLGAELSNWSCLLNNFYKETTPNPHLHIHVRPRYKNAIPVIISPFRILTESLNEQMKIIKKGIRENKQDTIRIIVSKIFSLFFIVCLASNIV